MSFDIQALLQDWQIPYFLPDGGKVGKGWIGITCPLCRDTSNHGGFRLTTGQYNCWLCGGSSSHFVISRLLRVSTKQARLFLQEYKRSDSWSRKVGSRDKIKGVSSVDLPGDRFRGIHKKYLRSRGFDPDYLIEKYNLKATLEDGSFRYRIITPIIEKSGRVISYQGRDVTGEQKIRWKGCSIEKSVYHYKRTLYGLPHCRGLSLGLVEGVADVWRMGDGFAATFGTSVTPFQIREMVQYDRIFLLFDPEEEAQEKAQKIAYQLDSLGRYVEVIELDGVEDPGTMAEDDVRYLKKDLGIIC